MKTLILTRHAKSSWDSQNLPDIERPLNKRGLRDAQFMPTRLLELKIMPGIILSSPATRAYTTAKLFAEGFNINEDEIEINEVIYGRGPKEIMKIINDLDDKIDCAMIFGHNPDVSNLSNYLCNGDLPSFPTCGVACIDFEADSWSNVGDEPGKLRFFENPKKYFKKD